jgi:hypothetical protein
MTKKCQFITQCGFFLNFSTNVETIREAWTKLYCDDLEVSELCERKKIRLRTGDPPADNMAPTGKFL